MLVIPGRHARPQPRLLRIAPQPTLGTLDHHPPVLRLDPEHGVGRLRRWFVFFCSGGHGIPLTLGVIGIHQLPNPSFSIPLHESPLGTDAADTQTHRCTHTRCPYPPSLGLLHGGIQSFSGVLNDTPSMAREVHGH